MPHPDICVVVILGAQRGNSVSSSRNVSRQIQAVLASQLPSFEEISVPSAKIFHGIARLGKVFSALEFFLLPRSYPTLLVTQVSCGSLTLARAKSSKERILLRKFPSLLSAEANLLFPKLCGLVLLQLQNCLPRAPRMRCLAYSASD